SRYDERRPYEHPFDQGHGHEAGEWDRAYARLNDMLASLQSNVASAKEDARWLLTSPDLVSARVLVEVVDERLAELAATAVAGGWTPADLSEIVRRRTSTRGLPALAALLESEVARHPADRVDPRWRGELEDVGSARWPDLRTQDGLTVALELAAVLYALPPITQTVPPP